MNTNSWATARGDTFDAYAFAGSFEQATVLNKDKKTTDFRRSFSSRAELQPPVGAEQRNLDKLALKCGIM